MTLVLVVDPCFVVSLTHIWRFLLIVVGFVPWRCGCQQSHQFSILTGDYVFSDLCDWKQIQTRIKEGERSVLDPHLTTNASHAEHQLVHVIQNCWEQDPKDRYDIQDIIVILQQALETQLQGLEPNMIR